MPILANNVTILIKFYYFHELLVVEENVFKIFALKLKLKNFCKYTLKQASNNVKTYDQGNSLQTCR